MYVYNNPPINEQKETALKNAMAEDKSKSFNMGKSYVNSMHRSKFFEWIHYLSRRYAKYISGSDCVRCWGFCGKSCLKFDRYSQLEKMSYNFLEERRDNEILR